jgi:nitrogen regulatory protein PII
MFRGHEYRVDFLRSIKIELVVLDDQVDEAVDAIVTNAATGNGGAGKLFLSRIDDYAAGSTRARYPIVRIRNQQRGVAAL